jgi:site-specific DNA recombinase
MISQGLDLVGYRRVSTEDQKDRGSSLDAQKAKLEAFASAFGHKLVETIDDGGESAKSFDRPGFKRAISLLRSGVVAGILVANLDRLTRHVGDLVGLVEGDFLADNGPVLLSASEPIETRTAVGRLQIYILATVSQYQREAGVERTAGVMRFKRSRRERTGNLGFGLKLDSSDPRRSKGDRPIALVESPEDIEIAGKIRTMRDFGLSLQEIADSLNDRGIPSKRGVTKRSTGKWAKSSIHAILERAEAPHSREQCETLAKADSAEPGWGDDAEA